jgi:uncharacterized protein YbaR (Trm112 family)
MKLPELVDLIACPDCEAPLELKAESWSDVEVESGHLACSRGPHRFPIREFIPRFVPSDEYADAFTLEWNAFRAHLDSFTGLGYLDHQLRGCLDFPIERLDRKLVLDPAADSAASARCA